MPAEYTQMVGAPANIDNTSQAIRQNLKLMPVDVARGKVVYAQEQRKNIEEIWRQCKNYYRGQTLTGPLTDKFERRANVNLVLPVADTVIAAVSTRRAKFNVFPKAEEDEAAAELLEVVINHDWREHNGHQAFRLAQKDAAILGWGILKVAWLAAEQTEPWPDHIVDQETERKLTERDLAIDQDPSSERNLPTEEDVRRSVMDDLRKNPQQVSYEQHPVIQRVSPFDFLIDPEAPTFAQASWVCQMYREPIALAREKGKPGGPYSQRARDLKPTSLYAGRPDQPDIYRPRHMSSTPPKSESVLLYEFHDLLTGRWCIFPHEGDFMLTKWIDEPLAGTQVEHPFEMLRHTELPDELYPMGAIEPLIPLQDELNQQRTDMMLQSLLQIPKFVASEGLDEKARRSLGSPNPMQLVELTQPGLVPANAISALPTPNISQDRYAHNDIIRRDIEAVSAVPEIRQGIGRDTSRRSAREISELSGSLTTRMGEKLDAAMWSATRCAQRIALLNQTYLDGEEVARRVGPRGGATWEQYTARLITGHKGFDFEVEQSSMLPRDDAAARQDAVALLQQLAPLGEFINVGELALDVLKAWGIDDTQNYIAQQQPAPPDQQQLPLEGGGAPAAALPPAPVVA